MGRGAINMKKVIYFSLLLSALLISLIFVSPTQAISTTDTCNFTNLDLYDGYCEVRSDIDVTLSSSDNWRYGAGSTDTLTITFTPGTTNLQASVLGYYPGTYYYDYFWEEVNFNTPLGESGKQLLVHDTYSGWYYWVFNLWVNMEGKATATIQKSGDINSVDPITFEWTSSGSKTSTLITEDVFMGSGAIDVIITYYARFKWSILETYDGYTYWSDESDWSSWYTIGTDTATLELNGFGGSIVTIGAAVVVIVVIAMVTVIFIKKRKGGTETPTVYKPPSTITTFSSPWETAVTISKSKIEPACPHCGVNLPPDRQVAFCPYCGGSMQ